MTEYKVLEGKRGKRYLRNNRFINRDKILISVLERLTPDQPVRIKECLFCGGESKMERPFNRQSVVLCDEHYYSRNIGQIAAEIRKQAEEVDNE